MPDPLWSSWGSVSLPHAGAVDTGACFVWIPTNIRPRAASYRPRMTDDMPLARQAHRALEPLHTLVYFVPEAAERYAALGVSGGMRGYFASRSAPLGIVPAEVVVATFYNFAPAQVAKAIPSVWEATTPDQVLAARIDVADAALRRFLGDDVIGGDEVAQAAALAREATRAADL